MRLFRQAQQVACSPETLQKAQLFAQQVSPSTPYADSAQNDLEKIRQDHFISKIGEEAVAWLFAQLGQTVQGPDYQIYSAKQKSWAADLQIGHLPLAVKTQSQISAARYGLSWTFQADPKGRFDPILSEPEAWVCFVLCDETQGYQSLVYPPFQIKELSLSEPRLQKLKGKKKVVYAQDLPHL